MAASPTSFGSIRRSPIRSLFGSMRRLAFLLLVASSLVTLVVYAGYVDTGVFYDDFHFVRPLTATELHRVWYGSWDPAGIESVFFRPLTALFFAARFWLFGLNSFALHVLSIVLHVACATAVGLIVRREGLGVRPAVASSVLYAVYPTLSYSQVSWLTNQMHLLESLCVLGAIYFWQGVRTAPIYRQWPLVAFATIAFLVKEDAIMLLPVLAVLSARYWWLAGNWSLKRVGWLVLAAVTIAAALFGWRAFRLGTLGGYGRPDLTSAQLNWWRGPVTALLLWPTRRWWQAVAATIAIVPLLVASVWALRRRHVVVVVGWAVAVAVLGVAIQYYYLPQPVPYPTLTIEGVASGVVVAVILIGLGLAVARRDSSSVHLAGTGLIVMLGFNLPFVLVSKREQYHLISFGAVLILAAAVEAILKGVEVAARRTFVSLSALAVIAVPLGLLARQNAADFAPCSRQVLTIDSGVASWWVVPSALSDWSQKRAAACVEHRAPPDPTSIPWVVWGELDSPQLPSAQPNTRWLADESVFLVNSDIDSLSLGLRRPVDLNIGPTRIRFRTSADENIVNLEPGDWKYVTVRFRRDWLLFFRRAHRLSVTVDSWFVPAVVDFRSSDLRRFGAEFQVLDLR